MWYGAALHGGDTEVQAVVLYRSLQAIDMWYGAAVPCIVRTAPATDCHALAHTLMLTLLLPRALGANFQDGPARPH
jgi:hypothetical protein